VTAAPTPSDADQNQAAALTGLIEHLIELAVFGTDGPVPALGMLRLAHDSLERVVDDLTAHKARAWSDGLMKDMPDDSLASLAKGVLQRNPAIPECPDDVMEHLVAAAGKILGALPTEARKSSRYMLTALYIAERIILSAKKDPDERDALFLELMAIKRSLSRVTFEVEFIGGGVSRGGSA